MSDQTLTEDEKVEAELGEQARIASDTWGSVAPGKADNFKSSFTRMLGLLSPYKAALVVVTLMGTAGVVLTVIAPKILRSCGTKPMPAFARPSAFSRVTSPPLSLIVPSRAWTSPAMVLSSVDLPAPFGPMIETISPGATVREVPFRICSAAP